MRRPLSLRSRRDFLRVLAEGARSQSQGITVVVARRHPEDAPSRLGMSVRAGALGAVGRNRIRRRLRAAFLVSAPPGYDVIVQAGPGVAEQDYQELAKAMKRGLNRAVKG